MAKIKNTFIWKGKDKFVTEKVFNQRLCQSKNGQNIGVNQAAKYLTEEGGNVENNYLGNGRQIV